MTTLVRRIGLALTVALAVVCSNTTTASALSLHATDWESSIISIAPATHAVGIEVLNGGEALRLTAQPQHAALILGYRNEPYLRINADGEVQANLKSPTWWSNKTGTGSGSVPDTADPAAEPEWSTIGSNGSVAWHDHRIQAMPGVTTGTDWTVLVTVDDMPIVVRGQLNRLPSHAPLLEVLLAIVAAATIVILGFRKAWTICLVSTLVGAAFAIVVAIGGWIATPSGFTHPWLPLLASVLTGALAFMSVLLRNTARRLRVTTMVGAVAALAWWVALNFSALTAVFVPNTYAASVVRFSVGLDLGIVVGVGVVIVLSGGFTDLNERDQAVVDQGTDAASV